MVFAATATRAHGGTLRELEIACGQCIGCRLERSRQWAVRCMHEAKMHPHNCFVTVTYAPEHLPPHGSLTKRHHQLLLKRIRSALVRKHGDDSPFLYQRAHVHAHMGLRPIPQLRYYMAGEYGDRLARPHYHFCLFGIDFADRKYWGTTKAGSKIFRSPTLEKLWPYGHSTVGDLTFESAAYTARYVMKKINGKQKQKHYEKVDPTTGEIIQIQDEYNEMSRAQGIGKTWIQKYAADAYDALPGKVIVNGKEANTPRYYDKQLKKWDADKYELLLELRQLEGRKHAADQTPRRLRAREEVAAAKISHLKRTI